MLGVVYTHMDSALMFYDLSHSTKPQNFWNTTLELGVSTLTAVYTAEAIFYLAL